MIEITVETLQQISVVKMVGRIDSATADTVHEKIVPMSVPDCKIILDMSNVDYMSSAGLRVLLTIHRKLAGGQGKIILVGLSDELKDVMSMTGFLDHFTLQDTVTAALQAFN